MTIIPIIMCGGGGTRLWPASGAERPKQFLQLLGPTSSFQDSVLRAGRVPGAGRPVVVAGAAHLGHIRAQLAEIDCEGWVLLEPEPRDSAAAVAAAVAWIGRDHPDAVTVIMSADHHLPDAGAFGRAVQESIAAAQAGAIVTLGLTPAVPATAYGYIRPAEGPDKVKPVAAFVEKPDEARARTYVESGYLWNTGYFIARVETLREELERFAPKVLAAAEAAVLHGSDRAGVMTLGTAFRSAPKLSFDHAVMEKTRRAAVLPVDFEWSDLGAWDAIWAAAPKDHQGNALTENSQAVDARDNLVVAPEGVHVALLGVTGVGVIIEGDAVLVCDLAQSQLVRQIAQSAPAVSSPARFASLSEAATWFEVWLRTTALPLWATAGFDDGAGAFRDALRLDGAAEEHRRRARVQARQMFVYARAANAGFEGPWLGAALRAYRAFLSHFRAPEGLFVYSRELDGAPLDSTLALYEQAFSLLAMAELERSARPPEGLREIADQVRLGIEQYRHPGGGFREVGAHPFQANALMHLLEAMLAWEAVQPEGTWGSVADELCALCLDRFIDADGGFLREFFDEAWRPAAGDDGRWVEPGHQFEWAWLLSRWDRARNYGRAGAAARRLYEIGKRGVDRVRNVAVDVVWDDLSVRDPMARLWPQTERLKAALLFEDEAEALAAANGLFRYLDVPVRGLWRDKLKADGSWVEEPAPASSFYHVVGAVLALLELQDPRARDGQRR